MAEAIIHRTRLNLLQLWQTMHSRDNLVLALRNRLGRRKRISVITAAKQVTEKMNAGNELRRRMQPGTGTQRGTVMGVWVGQRFPELLSLLSPISQSQRSCWTNRHQRHYGYSTVEQIIKCFLVRRNSLSILQWSIVRQRCLNRPQYAQGRRYGQHQNIR